MAGEELDDRVPEKQEPSEERVRKLAEVLAKDDINRDDSTRAARALLLESDARTDADPAPRDPDDDRVDRRTSDIATPPLDADDQAPPA